MQLLVKRKFTVMAILGFVIEISISRLQFFKLFGLYVKKGGRFRFEQGVGSIFKKIYSHLGVVVVMSAVCQNFYDRAIWGTIVSVSVFFNGKRRAVSFCPRVGWTFKKIYTH